jgi:hypothetical protein
MQHHVPITATDSAPADPCEWPETDGNTLAVNAPCCCDYILTSERPCVPCLARAEAGTRDLKAAFAKVLDEAHLETALGFPLVVAEPDGLPPVATVESVMLARLLRKVTNAVDAMRAAVEGGALAEGAEREGAWHVYNLVRSLRQVIADRAARFGAS